MSIVNFDKVKVTTMTVIVHLEGNAVIESIFPLLPITRLDLKNISRTTKKFKIPWPGSQYAGSIFSAKYSGITRGIVKTTTNKSFRNSVAIDICTSVKNISAKLVKNKIHMCGANSEALAEEAGQHIVNHLLNIQKELDYISNNLQERDEAITWLIKETKGDSYIINEETQEIIELEEGEIIRNSVIYDKNNKVKYNYREIDFKWDEGDDINPDNIIVNKYGQPYFRSLTKKERKERITEYPIMQIGDIVKINSDSDSVRFPTDYKGNKLNKVCRIPLRVMQVTSVKFPKCIVQSLKEEEKLTFPKHINSRIASFLIQYVQDYAYHHIFIDFLENFKDITRVFIPNEKIPLSIGEMNIAMINYSYSLKMNIDRWKLAELIDGYEGFHARYNNTTDHHVTITLAYQKNNSESINRKNLQNHTWMCYRSGIVTQSGPSPALMAPVYYKFMKFIQQIKNQIEIKDGKPFTIKYTSNKSIEKVDLKKIPVS